MKTIKEYDFLRAVAVLLVILGHCTYYKIITDYGGIDYSINEKQTQTGIVLGFITHTLYSFHMPLFIALSGCLWAVRIRYKGVQSFSSLVKNKRKRLLVPFLITALFWSIPLKYLSGYWHGSFVEIIRQIFLGQILMFGNFNSHLWFIQSLFFIFIFAYIIEKSNWRQCPVKFMASLLVLSMMARFLESRYICFLNIQSAFIYLLWFYIGFYFEHIREKVNKFVDKHIGWWITGIFIILYPIFVFVANKLPHGMGFGYITYFSKAVLGIAITYLLCYKLNIITPPNC